MIEILEEVKNKIIPGMLFSVGSEKNWETLNIDYEHPYVHRLWKDIDIVGNEGREKIRVYLHKLFPVPPGSKPLFHPHPWESAIEILEGRYKMAVGHSNESYVTPSPDATLILTAGSKYEMLNEFGWHYVYPLDDKPVYSIMITGKQFTNPVANEVWESIKKELSPLTYGQKMEMISKFKEFYK